METTTTNNVDLQTQTPNAAADDATSTSTSTHATGTAKNARAGNSVKEDSTHRRRHRKFASAKRATLTTLQDLQAQCQQLAWYVAERAVVPNGVLTAQVTPDKQAVRLLIDPSVNAVRVIRQLMECVRSLDARRRFWIEDSNTAESIAGGEFGRRMFVQTAANIAEGLGGVLMQHFITNIDNTGHREPRQRLTAQQGRSGLFSSAYFRSFQNICTNVQEERSTNPYDVTDCIATGRPVQLFLTPAS